MLKKAAVENGAYSVDFYDLTPREICDLITSEAKRRESLNRACAVFCWNNAYLTGLAVNSPKNFPRSPEQHFRFLSEDIPDWQRSKEQMARFAARHNSMIEGRDNA